MEKASKNKQPDIFTRNEFSNKEKMVKLKVDNGTTRITIPTPKGWKCPIPKCKTNFKHTHNLWTKLKNSDCIPKRAKSTGKK